jgi:hypothetical protein
MGGAHGRRALVSYLRAPFVSGRTRAHTNTWECFTAAEALDALGYRVDVVEYLDGGLPDYSGYDVLYGFGEPFEWSFFAPGGDRLRRVYYGPGCSPAYTARASALRLADAFARTGVWMPDATRVGDRAWRLQTLLADTLIALGDEFVLETYRAEGGRCRYERVRPFFFDAGGPAPPAERSDEARRHFLWFGSTGAIHKGLDLLLEHFAARPDLHLHVCGLKHWEARFLEHYRPLLRGRPNIEDHGFVPLESDAFRALVARCGAAIYPTACEGGAPALLNVVANGALLPVAPATVGVDLGGGEVPIEALSVDGVAAAVEATLALSAGEHRERAEATRAFVRAEYPYERYRAELHAALRTALAE